MVARGRVVLSKRERVAMLQPGTKAAKAEEVKRGEAQARTPRSLQAMVSEFRRQAAAIKKHDDQTACKQRDMLIVDNIRRLRFKPRSLLPRTRHRPQNLASCSESHFPEDDPAFCHRDPGHDGMESISSRLRKRRIRRHVGMSCAPIQREARTRHPHIEHHG